MKEAREEESEVERGVGREVCPTRNLQCIDEGIGIGSKHLKYIFISHMTRGIARSQHTWRNCWCQYRPQKSRMVVVSLRRPNGGGQSFNFLLVWGSRMRMEDGAPYLWFAKA